MLPATAPRCLYAVVREQLRHGSRARRLARGHLSKPSPLRNGLQVLRSRSSTHPDDDLLAVGHTRRTRLRRRPAASRWRRRRSVVGVRAAADAVLARARRTGPSMSSLLVLPRRALLRTVHPVGPARVRQGDRDVAVHAPETPCRRHAAGESTVLGWGADLGFAGFQPVSASSDKRTDRGHGARPGATRRPCLRRWEPRGFPPASTANAGGLGRARFRILPRRRSAPVLGSRAWTQSRSAQLCRHPRRPALGRRRRHPAVGACNPLHGLTEVVDALACGLPEDSPTRAPYFESRHRGHRLWLGGRPRRHPGLERKAQRRDRRPRPAR